MKFKSYDNRERDYLDEEDSEEEREEKRRSWRWRWRWRTSFGGVAANSVMNGVGGFCSFLINALSLSLSSLSRRDRESEEFGAKTEVKQRDEAEKNHVSERVSE